MTRGNQIEKLKRKNSEDKRKAEERSKILKAQRETKVGGNAS